MNLLLPPSPSHTHLQIMEIVHANPILSKLAYRYMYNFVFVDLYTVLNVTGFRIILFYILMKLNMQRYGVSLGCKYIKTFVSPLLINRCKGETFTCLTLIITPRMIQITINGFVDYEY